MVTKLTPNAIVKATKAVPIDSITPHPDNPRLHTSRSLVVDSIATHGTYKPLIVQKSTNHIIAGNGTWDVLVEAGYKEVAVTFVAVNDLQAKAIMLADNRTAETSAYNEIALAEILAEMPDLKGTGWTPEAAEDILQLIQGPDDMDELVGDTDDYDPDDPDAWPRISIPLSPRIYGAYIDIASDHDGNHTEALTWLMEKAGIELG